MYYSITYLYNFYESCTLIAPTLSATHNFACQGSGTCNASYAICSIDDSRKSCTIYCTPVTYTLISWHDMNHKMKKPLHKMCFNIISEMLQTVDHSIRNNQHNRCCQSILPRQHRCQYCVQLLYTILVSILTLWNIYLLCISCK